MLYLFGVVIVKFEKLGVFILKMCEIFCVYVILEKFDSVIIIDGRKV